MHSKINEFTLYTLDQTLSDPDIAQPLDQVAYSRFKYGDTQVAYLYAKALASGMMRTKIIYPSQKYLLTGSAYFKVPTAANSIVSLLSNALKQAQYEIETFKIHSRPFYEDYSELSEEERERTLRKLEANVNGDVASKLKGAHIIVVDDIKITGLHQKVIEDLVIQLGASSVLFCYVATLKKPEEIDCQIESRLNHRFIDSLDRLYEIIRSPHFAINSRLCKYLLTSDPRALEDFAKHLTDKERHVIAEHMQKDGYHLMPACKDNFNLFKNAKPRYERIQFRLKELDYSV